MCLHFQSQRNKNYYTPHSLGKRKMLLKTYVRGIAQLGDWRKGEVDRKRLDIRDCYPI